MITVHLNNLRFIAYHGIHEEEKILGNDYIIDAAIAFQEEPEIVNTIKNTINYAAIYQIIKEKMMIPTPLMETLVMEMGSEIHKEFPQVTSVNISIKKMHPPIEGIQGSAGVSWYRQF